jgi:hypothetical protein
MLNEDGSERSLGMNFLYVWRNRAAPLQNYPSICTTRTEVFNMNKLAIYVDLEMKLN